MVFSQATTQALWISKYFSEIRLPLAKAITIHADNKGLIVYCLNDKNYCQTKHINIQYHFVKDQVESRNIVFKYIPTANNLTDLFTKPLVHNKI